METAPRDDAPSPDSPVDARIAPILQALATRSGEEAWAEFLRLYSPLISSVARLFGRNPDQVGEVFLFVCEGLARDGFRRLRRFKPDGPARFSTWLYAVARNACRDRARRRAARPRPLPLSESNGEDAAVSNPGPEDQLALGETERLVARFFQETDAETRRIAFLRFRERARYREIASIMGLPMGTVKFRVHDIRRRLRVFVEDGNACH